MTLKDSIHVGFRDFQGQLSMQIRAGGTHIEIDDQGPAFAEPLLLIMGLGFQLTAWPEAFIQLLLARGFRVIRMDNRDCGLSQGFDHLGTPNTGWTVVRYLLHMKVPAPYLLADMAADALGVLDALGLTRAHVCGASLGGMVAQHLAAGHPQRLKSLTLMMTTAGARHEPKPKIRALLALLSQPVSSEPADLVKHLESVLAVIGSPDFPPDTNILLRRLHEMILRAPWRIAGTARQLAAVLADGDRTPLLAHIKAPTCVIHGTSDPLIRVAAALELSSQIEGATANLIEGMGHDLPAELLAYLADTIRANADRAR